MTREISDRVDVPVEFGIPRLQPPQLLGPLLDGPPHGVGVDARFDGERGVDGGGHRRPDVGLAIGCACRPHHDGLVLERVDDLLGETGLAGAGLADDRHDPAMSAADDLDGGIEQRLLTPPADERHVGAHGTGAGGCRSRDQPRLLDLLAPLIAVTPNGSRAMPDEHSAAVALPINTPPGGAIVWSRDAVFTTSPIAV